MEPNAHQLVFKYHAGYAMDSAPRKPQPQRTQNTSFTSTA